MTSARFMIYNCLFLPPCLCLPPSLPRSRPHAVPSWEAGARCYGERSASVGFDGTGGAFQCEPVIPIHSRPVRWLQLDGQMPACAPQSGIKRETQASRVEGSVFALCLCLKHEPLKPSNLPHSWCENTTAIIIIIIITEKDIPTE